MDEEKLESLPIAKASAPTKEIDRINNKEQKETALYKAGLYRQKYIEKIVLALQATKMEKSKEVGEDGRYPIIEVPDWDLIKWGTEQAIKVFNDDRASIVVEGNTVNNNILNIDVRSLDTTQLIDVLMGRHKPIVVEGVAKP